MGKKLCGLFEGAKFTRFAPASESRTSLHRSENARHAPIKIHPVEHGSGGSLKYSISLATVAVALYLIPAHWYPDFHFAIDGDWQGVRIIAPHFIWDTVRTKALNVQARLQDSKSFASALAVFLANHGGKAEDYRLFPYNGRYGTCTLAFTPAGEPLEALGCEPL